MQTQACTITKAPRHSHKHADISADTGWICTFLVLLKDSKENDAENGDIGIFDWKTEPFKKTAVYSSCTSFFKWAADPLVFAGTLLYTAAQYIQIICQNTTPSPQSHVLLENEL